VPQPRKKTKAPPKGESRVIDGSATEVATEQALVPVPPPDTPAAVWTALDKADEELVAAEIAGDLIETWAYEFNMGNSQVRGLSYEGVNQGVRICNARNIAKISCPDTVRPEFTDTVDAEGNPIWECLAYAVDELVGGGSWGLAHAEKFPTTKSGKAYHDPMAKRKALSKAQRNAKGSLLPGPIKLEILQGVTGAKIKRIQTERQQAVAGAQQKQVQRGQQTTAAEPERGAKLTQPQVRMLFGKFKEHGGPALAKQLKVPEEDLAKAVFGWAGGTLHADRLLKDRKDAVLAAIADLEATIAAIADNAREANAPDHATAIEVLRRLPALAKALDLALDPAPNGGGEQGTLV
jgi:hypothetical protein